MSVAFVSNPISDGSGPLKRLNDNEAIQSAFKFPYSVGIVPVKLLLSTNSCILERSKSCPSSVGSVPFNLLFPNGEPAQETKFGGERTSQLVRRQAQQCQIGHASKFREKCTLQMRVEAQAKCGDK